MEPCNLYNYIKKIPFPQYKIYYKKLYETTMSLVSVNLKAPITIAADDIFCNIILDFRAKLGTCMIFHENRLSADAYHEIPCLICYFQKGGKI